MSLTSASGRTLMLVLFVTSLLPVFPCSAFQGMVFTGPQVANLRVNAGQVGLYEKFELTFDVPNTVATNFQFPYDPNPPAGIKPGIGISVDGLFSPDNWATTIVQPGFLYQDYVRHLYGGEEHLYPSGNPVWKIRFAPRQVGAWHYRIRVTDASGTAFYPADGALSFNVVPSARQGFLRVSAADPRYFEFSDGTPFIGVGHGSDVDPRSRTYDAEAQFDVYQANRANFFRVWMSGSSVTGSAWASWYSHHLGGDGYVPPTSLTTEEAYGSGDFSMKLSTENPCMYQGWTTHVPVIPDTTYRVRVRVKTVGITGPATAGQPYGFVVKLGGWLDKACTFAGKGTPVTPYITGNQDWQIIEGTLTTDSNQHFLDNLYLSLVNTTGGAAYVDEVWVQEDLGGGLFGPNVVRKPSMNYHFYFDQVASWQWDFILDQAAEHGVFLKLVILEKNDWVYTHIDSNGNPVPEGDVDNFYAVPNTKVRWLHQAFWRYLVARWGYSTAVHSWELLNEGDPYNGHHYELANALGQYMDENDPNQHMTTTSLWHSFPADDFWGNPAYSAVDYADLHAYVSTGWGLYELWGTNPSSPLSFEDRVAYVRNGQGYSLRVPGTTRFFESEITPREFTIRGRGEWVIRYWVKTENWTGQCSYSIPNSLAGPRLRWVLDSGEKANVIPAAASGQDFVCTAPSGTHDWQQFSSGRTTDGQVAPIEARLILNDDELHTLRVSVSNSFGNGGWAWIDDVTITRPDGREMYINGGLDLQRMDYDAAMYTKGYSVIDSSWRSDIQKPLVRGEAGLDYYTGEQQELPELAQDVDGVWLHNFIWGQINPGGMYDLYWWTDNIWVYNLHRHFKPFRDFMDGIPLNNGDYDDAKAQASHPDLRVWGQKDITHGRAHLWIQNRKHTWKNVVDGVTIASVSGTVSVENMPDGQYILEWWDTYSGTCIRTESLTVMDGHLVFSVPPLSKDIAVKVGLIQPVELQYTVSLPLVVKTSP